MSCGLITGYELELLIIEPQNPYQYNVHPRLVRQVGPSGTYYILKDEDRLEGRVPTHVTVLAIYLQNLLNFFVIASHCMMINLGSTNLHEWKRRTGRCCTAW